MSKPIVLTTSEWDTDAIKFMPPKVNDKGMLSINLISTQTNRALHISTPMMMTWGISDYDDGSGGDGSDVGAATVVTIGVRTGTAVTFSATGSSFNVVGRSGNIPISI